MTRKVREIQDLVIDEISLVDKGANQHATVTIAKSADGDKESYMDIYDEQGNPLDPDALEIGDVVYDAAGDAYEIQAEEEKAETREPELVGKSAFKPRETRKETAKVSKGFAEGLREELSKALTDRDRDDVISKAFAQIEALSEAAEIAKAAAEEEREIRLTNEYTEIAKSYSLPGVEDEKLGGVLKRAAEALSFEDCEVIGKALELAADATNALYEEHGAIGGGDNSDVLRLVDEHVNQLVTKSGDTSREELVAKMFADNPEAYDQYLAER